MCLLIKSLVFCSFPQRVVWVLRKPLEDFIIYDEFTFEIMLSTSLVIFRPEELLYSRRSLCTTGHVAASQRLATRCHQAVFMTIEMSIDVPKGLPGGKSASTKNCCRSSTFLTKDCF